MPNELTGDFDVVAMFSVPAVNRLLAGMHRNERFPHSLTLRVDDTQRPGRFQHPSLLAAIDFLGDPVVDDSRIDGLKPAVPSFNSPGSHPALDAIANFGAVTADLPPFTPSHLKGKAQVQISAPVVEVADSTGDRVAVRMGLISRYSPDAGTSAAAEFIRGELKITAPVNQSVTQVGNVVTIDVKANSASIDFIPSWSSRILDPSDLAGINLLLKNALRTSLLPSNIALPQTIRHVQFRTVGGAQPGVAVMIDADEPAGNRDSVNTSFLSSADQFAFAVGSDFVKAAFQPTLDNILSQPVPPVTFKVDTYIHTFTVTYTITLNNATILLESGKMVLSIKGHATTDSWTPNFDFTLRQDLTLLAAGDSAELEVGNLSLDTSSWIVDRFRGAAMGSLRHLRDTALAQSNARATVRSMLSADRNLGAFLRSLLAPARGPVPPGAPAALAYTTAEIRPAGIVLHGSLAIGAWPPARVEYEQLPSTATESHYGVHGVVSGPEYSALRTWIPGGAIQSYEWKSAGQTGTGYTDDNRFIFRKMAIEPPISAAIANIVTGYAPLCVTVRGTRLSAGGPVSTESVTATACGFGSFPLPVDLAVSAAPLMALSRMAADGTVELAGHTPAVVDRTGRRAPNMVVHFADRDSLGHLGRLTQALGESKRSDAPTAFLVIADHDDLASSEFVPGITYTDSGTGAWQRHFDVSPSSPGTTLLVAPSGRVVWRESGAIDTAALAAVMAKTLVAAPPIPLRILPQGVRVGQIPPNFLFSAGGSDLTLRKLAGRAVTLVFLNSASRPSVELLREISTASGSGIVLGVSHGAPAGAAKSAPWEGIEATMVDDSSGRISKAYGITVWPTVVHIDEAGVTRQTSHGRTPANRPVRDQDTTQRSATR